MIPVPQNLERWPNFCLTGEFRRIQIHEYFVGKDGLLYYNNPGEYSEYQEGDERWIAAQPPPEVFALLKPGERVIAGPLPAVDAGRMFATYDGIYLPFCTQKWERITLSNYVSEIVRQKTYVVVK